MWESYADDGDLWVLFDVGGVSRCPRIELPLARSYGVEVGVIRVLIFQ